VTPKSNQIIDVTSGRMARRTAVYRADYDLEIFFDEWAAGVSQTRVPSQHAGEEFGIVTEGTLQLQLGDELHTAEEGALFTSAPNTLDKELRLADCARGLG
jgi:hypothetical protein